MKRKRDPAQISMTEEIIVDLFAGGGGASTGIEMATGRVVAVAVNHNPEAILLHQTNHPYAEHYQEDVWKVDPRTVCKGRPVGLLWAAPDCRHFSKAKGAALVDRKIRGLAWVILRWAGTVRPRVILMENVEEFVTWGPVRKGKPVKKLSGKTFEKFVSQFRALGYEVDWNELVAADYGAPTSRKRFVLVARCDGRPIVWPERTHAPAGSKNVRNGKCKPWRAAAEIIDWSLPMYSIFDSKEQIKQKYGVNAVRPLAENTMRRIICGTDKYTIKNERPFFLIPTGYGEREGLLACHLDKYFGGGYSGVGNDLNDPLTTVTHEPRHSMVAAHVAEFKGKDKGQSAGEPLRTITAGGGEFGAVNTVIERYDGNRDLGYWPEIRKLLNKHCGYTLKEDEVLLLIVSGIPFYIRDILLRMLAPRELYNAMGFPPDYIIDHDYKGNEYKKSSQVARCGNAVCPPMAEAVVRANLPEWCGGKIETMEQFKRIVSA